MGYRGGLDRAEARARRYDGLVEIISADAVGKLPDSNIADALDRLPSVYRISDQGEGRYLSLRGASQVLDTVTFNGVTIAASDTDGRSGRAAPLDVLSASAVSDVEIHSVIEPRPRRRRDRRTDRRAHAAGPRLPQAHRQPDGRDRHGRLRSRARHPRGRRCLRRHLRARQGVRHLPGRRELGAREYFSPFSRHGRRRRPERRGSRPLSRPYPGRGLDRPARADQPHRGPGLAGRGRKRRLAARLRGGLQRRGAAAGVHALPAWRLTAPSADAFSWRGLRVRTETRRERQERAGSPVRAGRSLGPGRRLDPGGVLQPDRRAKEAQPLSRLLRDPGRPRSAGRRAGHRPLRIVDGISLPDGALIAPNGQSAFDGGFQRLFRIRRITSTVLEDITTGQVDLNRRVAIGGTPVALKFGLKRLARVKSVEDADNRFNFTGLATLADPALAGRIAEYGNAGALGPSLDFPFADPAGMEALFTRRPDLFAFDAASSRENSVEDRYRIRETIWAGYLMGAIEVTPAFHVTVGARVERTNVEATADAFVAVLSATGFPAETDPLATLPFRQADILPTSGGRHYLRPRPRPAGQVGRRRGLGAARLGHPELRAPGLCRPRADLDTVGLGRARSRTGAPVVSGVNEIGNPGLRAIESRNWDVSAQYHLPRRLGWISAAGFYKALSGLPFEIEEDRPRRDLRRRASTDTPSRPRSTPAMAMWRGWSFRCATTCATRARRSTGSGSWPTPRSWTPRSPPRAGRPAGSPTRPRPSTPPSSITRRVGSRLGSATPIRAARRTATSGPPRPATTIASRCLVWT
ncbi:TonB-dependent receptor plug domain-containing protein [Caulobacter segnis]